MKPEMNRVTLTGYVGNVPDIRMTPEGKRVGHMSLATHRRGKETYTDWHKIVTFNEDFAEIMEKDIEKGSYVYIEGRLQTRKWTDKENKTHYVTEIILGSYDHKLFILKHEKHIPIEGRSLLEAFDDGKEMT